MQPTITLVDFEQIISIKLIQFYLDDRSLGHSKLIGKSFTYIK